MGDDDEFTEAVEFIGEAGYEAYFEGRPYMQLDVSEHFYWTMGAAVDVDDPDQPQSDDRLRPVDLTSNEGPKKTGPPVWTGDDIV